jgi:WD40 repeat protein
MIGPHICGDSIDINDNLLVAASYSIKDQLTIWDWTTASNLHTETLKTQEKKCMPYCAQFLRTEKNIIAIGGSGSDEVLLYDVNSHENIGSFSVSGNSVYSLHVSSQNQVAVVTGNKVEIHEITNQ